MNSTLVPFAYDLKRESFLQVSHGGCVVGNSLFWL